jgi:chloramphenicol O-acetyltransferase
MGDEGATIPNMEAYARPKIRVIDLPAWTRRDNHEFFRDFLYPNLGVMVRVDAGHAYSAAKERGIPFIPCDFYAI